MRSALILVCTFATSATAASKQECLDAHTEAQKSRKQGGLIAAKAQLLICNQDDCPQPVAADCAHWMSELELEQPTIVFAVRDDQGRDTPDVRISVDGTPLLDRLDGHPVDIDPGERMFRVQWPNGQVVEDRVVVHAGEKARLLEVIRPAPLPAIVAPVEPPAPSIPGASWVLWGAGALAGGSFAYFALSGRAQESDLSETCRGRCAPDDVSAVRQKYFVADLSWIIALAAAGAGTAIALWPSEDAGVR